jgi:hypothetical protein
MEYKSKIWHLKNDQKGQSTVEYILLLAVIISLVGTVLKSDMFRQLFGEEGKFAQEFRKEIEYSYRHALKGREFHTTPNYNQPHDSYERVGDTRFFGAKEKYPK